MNKKIVYGLLAILFILISAGCKAPEDTTPSIENDMTMNFRVALLLPYAKDDGGWAQSGYEGLMLIEKELNAQIAYTEQVLEDDAEKIFRQYATEGFDFIIGLGGQYVAAAKIVAEEFPKTKFTVVTRYEGNNRNLGALSFRESEIFYLAGAIAGLKTKTNKVGFIGGEQYAHLKEQVDAFEYGAKSINPNIEIFTDWVNSWSDPETARNLIRSQINKKADILLVALNNDQMIAFEEAEKAGIHTIAGSQDKHNLSPDTILTSTVQKVPELLLEGARLVRVGHWEGKQYKFGIQEGAQELAPYYGALTPEEADIIEKIKEDVITGKVDTLP